LTAAHGGRKSVWMIPRRLRRASFVFAAALIAPLFSVQADVAQAEPGSLLPTQSEVASLFPYLAGGQRSVYTSTDLSLLLEGCHLSIIVAHAHRGEGATFTTSDGRDPFDAGFVEPEPLMYRFANSGAAEKAFEEVLGYVRFCRGVNYDGRNSLRLKRLPDPGLGARSVAWRLNVKGNDGHGSTFQMRQAHVVVLRGRDLVLARLFSPGPTPSSQLAERLAKLTLRSSS
jgi:hypothetical protein